MLRFGCLTAKLFDPGHGASLPLGLVKWIMLSAVFISSILVGLLVLACIAFPLAGNVPPNLSAIQKGAMRLEVENLLGAPVECDTLRSEKKRCTYNYSYRVPVTGWIAITPPYLPLFHPSFGKLIGVARCTSHTDPMTSR